MMKRHLRYLAFLLCICTVVLSLSSCLSVLRIFNTFEQMIEEVAEETTGENADLNDSLPSDLPLQYTLSEDDRVAFAEKLAYCRTITLAGTDTEAIDAAWEELEALYYHVATQSQIAYILYCYDQSSEALSDAYLYATEMSNELYADYMALCQEIDASNSPYRDAFFEDWTADEMEEMRAYSEELSALYDENDRILVEYRALADDDTFDDQAAELYYQTVLNNNRIATLKGYSDYYQYAYEKIYLRDYGVADAKVLHGNSKQEILSLYRTTLNSFSKKYAELSSLEKTFISSFLQNDYDKLSTNYVMEYVNSLPNDMKPSMLSMFEAENSLFADGEHSYEGAFTGWLYEYERPFCYFGPGYQSSSTVIHELGHYYAEQFQIDDDLVMDLAEVHSQGNEMLFLAFLKDRVSDGIYDALSSYLLLDSLLTVLMCLVIDEFEMKVYQSADQITNPKEDLDILMREVIDGYGGDSFFMENIADPYWYWRRVTIESPVYYISYAVSGIVAIELYAEALMEYDLAAKMYRYMAEEAKPSQGFLEVIRNAGLLTPFDSNVFVSIRAKLEIGRR